MTTWFVDYQCITSTVHNFICTQEPIQIFSYIVNTICDPVCQNGWQTVANTRSSGATQQFGLNTLSSCQQNCINSAACVAIDFVNYQCWIHTNSANLMNKITTNGATQYIRCTQTCKSYSRCRFHYDPRQNVHLE